jgi:hypothetical protein
MIRIKLRGGLGNQLFQFSAGLYVCSQTNQDYQIDTEYINNTTPDIIRFGFIPENKIIDNKGLLDKIYITKPNDRHKSKWWEKKFESLRIISGETYTDPIDLNDYRLIKNKKIKVVRGFFQTQIYANELKNLGFAFNPINIKNISEKLVYCECVINNVTSYEMLSLKELINETTIVIHVRCYDISLSSSLGILSDLYYINAIKLVLNGDKNNKEFISKIENLLIISDDSNRAAMLAEKISSIFNLRTIILEGDSFKNNEVSFDLLNKAKIIITSNSSFSWWAAYLGGDKIVVVPSKWLYNHPYSNGLYLKDWITVNSEWI